MTLKCITFIKDDKQPQNIFRLRIPSRKALNKRNILLGILRKRQRFDEIRTIKAVENCRGLVLEEIENLFVQKEKTINSSLPGLINGKKSYSHIFDIDDLENIYKKTENIIISELFERFNRLIIWKLKKSNSQTWISDIFNPIPKYQKTKMRTILITSYMETLSRKAFSTSVESLMKDSIITKLVCNIDISTMLLPKLGINSSLETIELKDELVDRIGGALDSIKVGLVQDINHQMANTFYQTDDLLLSSPIEHKIHLLEKKIAREEIYERNLLEA